MLCFMFSSALCPLFVCFVLFFFFKQKTAYEMRISDWSSDVCSSDLHGLSRLGPRRAHPERRRDERAAPPDGGHPALGPVQPWPPDLGEAGDGRCGEAVRTEMRGVLL